MPYPSQGGATIEPHKTSHQDGGTDEISVASLSGLLYNEQTPVGHSIAGIRHDGLKFVRKSADETVNNSATLQNDNALLFAVAANEVWEFFLRARHTSQVGPQIQYAWAVPTGGVIRKTEPDDIGPLSAALSLPEYDGTTAVPLQTPTTDQVCLYIQWGLYVGGANAGNVQLQWAQNGAAAVDTKVLTNSFIIARKLA